MRIPVCVHHLHEGWFEPPVRFGRNDRNDVLCGCVEVDEEPPHELGRAPLSALEDVVVVASACEHCPVCLPSYRQITGSKAHTAKRQTHQRSLKLEYNTQNTVQQSTVLYLCYENEASEMSSGLFNTPHKQGTTMQDVTQHITLQQSTV